MIIVRFTVNYMSNDYLLLIVLYSIDSNPLSLLFDSSQTEYVDASHTDLHFAEDLPLKCVENIGPN